MSGPVDQDPPHRLGRGREEMPLPPKGPSGVAVHQPDVGLVHERGCLERLVGALATHPVVREAPQLFVHEGEKFRGGFRIAVAVANRVVQRSHGGAPGGVA